MINLTEEIILKTIEFDLDEDMICLTLAQHLDLEIYDKDNPEIMWLSDFYDIHVDPLLMSKSRYNKLVKAVNKYNFEGNGFEIRGDMDTSGYDFWSGENNRISFYVRVFNPYEADPTEVLTALWKANTAFGQFDSLNVPSKKDWEFVGVKS